MSRSRCGPSSTDASVVLDAVFRDQWGRVLATLVGILGDIELAEDAAAEAFAIAAERWPRDGEPANPTGWLITTARNRAIDQLRRQQVLAAKTTLLARDLEAGPQPPEALMDDAATIPDERLELIFTSPSRRRWRSPCAPSAACPPMRSRWRSSSRPRP